MKVVPARAGQEVVPPDPLAGLPLRNPSPTEHHPERNPTMDFGEPIFSYTAEQAIEDGVLHHPYPTRWPWLLVTQSVHTDCKHQKGQTYDQALTPLLMDCIMAAKGKKEDDFPVILEHTVAGTVWIMPNDLGGMTVMKPEDY